MTGRLQSPLITVAWAIRGTSVALESGRAGSGKFLGAIRRPFQGGELVADFVEDLLNF